MSGAITATDNLRGAARLVIQPAKEGVYLFVFETASSQTPEQDHLQASLAEALAQAAEDFGASDAWTAWEGPSLV
ncbi:MAG: hypothetical protein EON89_05260 [Brevundimonas sp.]|nr:MAG: hypothetical protein EON89_05260 [Brevundimonas sp.]